MPGQITEDPQDSTSREMPDLAGFRMTRQRRVVYDVLTEDLDHPTAADVFLRSKERMPGISLATVYNCLETLSQAGIVRQVNVDRDASRFCPNLAPHAHFFCSACEKVVDVGLDSQSSDSSPWQLPHGTRIDQIEVTLKGVCPDCTQAEPDADNS